MNRSRLWKPLLAVAVLGGALSLTFVWTKRNSLDFDIDGSSRAQAARTREPYDLTQLSVLNNVLLHVKEHYVDPARVNPRQMLLAGLNAIQRSVAPVIVEYEDNAQSLTLRVRDQSRQFRVDDVTAIWSLTPRFREIFSFLQENLQNEDIDLRDIEYAAINGMLHTLDPHSVLLTPETFSDMRAATRGEFGGLGILIGIREGKLVVIRPMPGTPAANAGFHRNDRIVKINDESTLNLPLPEAVNRLRGAPGSQVRVWIERDGAGGWREPRRFDLTRAIIHIESVESRMLEGGVGYVKVKSFQGNTFDDLQSALRTLHRQPMRGLVLDLRDNPGGLLDQAVRISDLFLNSGTIVVSTGPGEGGRPEREERSAQPEGTEENYPLVVLINGGSASASEIVAGALKNHDRALIVGQRSFGKGSVQVIYDDFRDGSALKLTTAQYLTPGDVSIQGVGIVPDVAIDPMTVDAEDMDLTVDQSYLREADLRAHLTNTSAREGAQSAAVLRYYLPKDVRQRLRDAAPEDAEENEREAEFLTRFARDLIVQTNRPGRREMLEDDEPVLARTRDAEMQKVVAELSRIGVDWSVAPDQGPSDVQVEVRSNKPDNTATAGEDFSIVVRVTNRGAAPLFQLRATTKSDNRLFDGRELVFGRLNPGETREWSTTLGICETKDNRRTCTVPKDLPDRADGIRVVFSEAHNHAPPEAQLRTIVRAQPRPLFAYDYQVADDGRGNGDGRLQRGELATVYLRIKNVGEGPSLSTQANLANLSGTGILLRDGRFPLEVLAPGREREVAFTFEVLENFEPSEAKLEISITDVELREGVSEKLLLPILAGVPAPVAARAGSIVLRDGAILRAQPDATGAEIGRVSGGALSARAQASAGEFVRIDGGGHPAWVANTDVVSGPAATGARIVNEFDHEPPRIDLGQLLTLETRDTTMNLRGSAIDRQSVQDLYIFVGARKGFYRNSRGLADVRTVSFDARLPLRPGSNYVTVVARHNNDIQSRRTFVVRRDAPDGSLLETPRYSDDEFEDEGGEE